jgi:hypothetical protein
VPISYFAMLHSAVLLVVLLAAYQPLFEGEWLFMQSWDDDSNYLRDPKDLLFTSLAWPKIWLMLTTVRINVYEPVSWLFKAVVYAGFGLDPRSYRVASLLVHWLNACLLFSVSQSMLEAFSTSHQPSARSRMAGSLVGSALYALHPLHSEVIGW